LRWGSEEGITGADECHLPGDYVYGCSGVRSMSKYLKELEVDKKQVVSPPLNIGAVGKDGHAHYAIPRYKFTNKEMDILMQPSAQINSYIIDAASYLIRRTAVNLAKEIGGLNFQTDLKHDPSCNDFLRGKLAIQIIVVPGHWQVLVRQGPIVTFYCSLGWSIDEETKRILGHLMKLKKGEKLRVICKQMQKQDGVTDCGLFAVFVATCVLFGLDPCVQTVDQSAMRASLLAMFTANGMEIFPRGPRFVERTKSVHFEEIEIPALWHEHGFILQS
jgi:hypothetical protein